MARKVLCELEEEMERSFKSYDVAEWLFKAGDFHSALNYINRYLSVDPDNADAQELMVHIIQGMVSAERPQPPSQRDIDLLIEADENNELAECPYEARRYVWQSCLADVNQARSSLNSSLARLTATSMRRNHPELINRLVDIAQQLLDVQVAMFNDDGLTDANSSEQFSEDRMLFCGAQRAQTSSENRENNNACLQTLAKQNDLLEMLQNQATRNEILLKNALEEISSLKGEVRRLNDDNTSSAIKTALPNKASGPNSQASAKSNGK